MYCEGMGRRHLNVCAKRWRGSSGSGNGCIFAYFLLTQVDGCLQRWSEHEMEGCPDGLIRPAMPCASWDEDEQVRTKEDF
jgi:hypothetical protein